MPSPLGVPYWFPFDVRRLAPTFALLTAEQAGSLTLALVAAWQAESIGDPPCCIPSDPDVLARLLRASWANIGAAIKRDFITHPERPEYLRCPWLYAEYERVQGVRETRATVGAEGGRKSGEARRAKSLRAAHIEANAKQKRSEIEIEIGGFTRKGEPPPVALGPDGPRSGGTNGDQQGNRTMADVMRYLKENPQIVEAPRP